MTDLQTRQQIATRQHIQHCWFLRMCREKKKKLFFALRPTTHELSHMACHGSKHSKGFWEKMCHKQCPPKPLFSALHGRKSASAIYLGHPKPQKPMEMKFCYHNHHTRSNRLERISGEVLGGHCAQQIEHENDQNISSKTSPVASPRLPPDS